MADIVSTLMSNTNFIAELDYIFAVSTRRHMNYQVKEVAPYWFKTQILRRKGLTPPRLYRFTDDATNMDKVIGSGIKGTKYEKGV